MMDWLDVVFKGVATVVSEWINAGEEERKAVEQRALDAVAAMVGDRQSTDAAHAQRVAETLAEIEKARSASALPK